jgi:WD40 repeat protein
MLKNSLISKTTPMLLGLLALIACNTTTNGETPIKSNAVTSLTKRWSGNSVLFAPPWQNITDIAWKPDGTQIAIADQNGTYITQPEPTATVQRMTQIERRIAWEIAGERLAGLSNRNATITIANPNTNLELNLGGSQYRNDFSAMAWSPDSQFLVGLKPIYGGTGTYTVWDVNTQREVRTLGRETYRSNISWSATGNKILIVGQGKGVFDAVTGVQQLTFSALQYPNAGEFSPNGTQMAIAFTNSGNERIDIFDSLTGAITKTIALTDEVPTILKWNPAGTQIGGGFYNGKTKIWDVGTGLVTRELRQQNSAITDLEWHPDGTPIAVASASDLIFYDANNGDEISRIANPDLNSRKNNVYGLSSHPSKLDILEVGRNSTISILDANNGITKNKIQSEQDGVYSAAYNSDGTKYATAGIDGTSIIWDSSNNTPISTLNGHAYAVRGMAWGANTIATASWDSTAKLWNSDTSEEIATIQHTDFVNAVAFNPASTQVATGSSDRTLKISSGTDGTLIRSIGTPAAILSLAWKSSGTQIAVGATDKNVYVYDSTTGALLKTLTGHIGAVRAVLWNKDDTAIISGGDDGNVKLWDIQTNTEITSIKPAVGFAVFALALSPNGTIVVAGTANGVTVAYNLQ